MTPSPMPAVVSIWPRTPDCDQSSLPVMYPRLDEMATVCRRVDPDGVLASDLSRRLGIPQ